MHRVELKAVYQGHQDPHLKKAVPNAPCGVERKYSNLFQITALSVPNAPCGVESCPVKREHDAF